jgi:Putative peptidoglycan binding domain
MSALKKIMAGALAFGVFAPAIALAQTSTTSPAALVGQIQTLQTQINSLQLQQQGAIASLVSTLRQGSASDQVAILQALLAADPSIYPEGVVSGFFGKLTAQAVKRFQKKHDLEQVGNVGPRTLKKLQEFLREHPLAFDMASSSATSTVGMWRDGKREEKKEDRRPCAIIPPGHLIAPGWLKKHRGEDRQIVPECRKLLRGIKDLRDDRDDDDDDDDDRNDDRRRGRHGTTTSPVLDTTAPVISAIVAGNIASTTATVVWTTNENATGRVYYATTTPVVFASALTMNNTSLTTGHSFGLTSLTASTTYHYVLESKDAANNTATTSVQSFTTTN